MIEGKVLAAARAHGFDSLTQVAKALIGGYPMLFEGIAIRSLGAKLSDLNRENVTWWRGRADRQEALEALLGLEAKSLVKVEQARRRGLWVFEELPELPPLNLAMEHPPVLAEPVPTTSGGAHPPSLEDWLRVGLGSDHEQPPLHRLGRGVQWLYVPKGMGRSLLLAQVQARNRLDVYEGSTLAESVAQASRLRPAVLAPAGSTSISELVALAQLDPEQPVLVISAHPLPRLTEREATRSALPSWEWLSATPSERARLAFTAIGAGQSGGIFDHHTIVEFRLQLMPGWRSRLLHWVEDCFAKQADTLFSAEGLTKWLEAFDPDEVWFPTPATALSLARLCHEVGERRLPKPDTADAGVRLVKQLGRADSRYLSLLARLVTHRWLDASTPWHQARPWDDWLAFRETKGARPEDKKAASRPAHSGSDDAPARASAPLAESDLDAAVKGHLIVPNSDGNYAFKSQAEAALVLRDLLRTWMQAGDLSKWGAQAIGDGERQQLLDTVLATLDDRSLVEICRAEAKLTIWNAAALGASETLLLAAGLRMAAGTLNYRPELGESLKRTLSRCLSDDGFGPLPYGRSLDTDIRQVDWTRSLWGWSLVAPKPERVPASMTIQFPGWGVSDATWLAQLQVPADGFAPVPPAHIRRLAAAVNTAADVSLRANPMVADNYAPEVLKALVGLLRSARSGSDVQLSWWHEVTRQTWATEVLASLLLGLDVDSRRRLSRSMLEACCIRTGDGFTVYRLVRSRIWRPLLDSEEAAEICDGLTPAAMSFVAHHIQSVPPVLRRAVADRIDPDCVPLDFDWLALLGATGIPSKARLDQLLCTDLLRKWIVTAALWRLYPGNCLEWATDLHNLHRQLFLEQCPATWAPQLAATLIQEPVLVADMKTLPHWATSRISAAGHRAPALLELLGSMRP